MEMKNTANNKNNNATFLIDYNFVFHRNFKYDINSPTNKIIIDINIKKDNEQRNLYFLNQQCERG